MGLAFFSRVRFHEKEGKEAKSPLLIFQFRCIASVEIRRTQRKPFQGVLIVRSEMEILGHKENAKLIDVPYRTVSRSQLFSFDARRNDSPLVNRPVHEMSY